MTPRLTVAEQKVVELLAHEMLSYQEAATRLHCKAETIRWHVNRIADRLPGTAPALRKLVAYYVTRAA